MGTEVEDAGTPTRARAGTLVVIGTMAAIAVVSVTAVVAWARMGQPGAAAEVASTEEVPATLADGSDPPAVPDPVAAAVDVPVVGARKLDELSGEMLAACSENMEVAWDPGNPAVDFAFVTADGVVASVTGTGSVPGGFGMGRGGDGVQQPDIRMLCDLQFDGDRVVNRGGGGGFEEVLPNSAPSGGFMSSSCCDKNGFATATASVAVPDEASWALQDRGSWYQAFDVEGLTQVSVSWRYQERRMGPGGPGGPPASTVLFLASDGNVISEDAVGGHF